MRERLIFSVLARSLLFAPIAWRPKVKKALSGTDSPKGAFAVGAFSMCLAFNCGGENHAK